MHCYCMMGGVASCMDLCPQAEPVQCPPGTTLQEDEEPVGTDDTPCSCKRQYCVPAKGTFVLIHKHLKADNAFRPQLQNS